MAELLSRDAPGAEVLNDVVLNQVLVRFPGGIGQQIRPLQRWLAGNRFDLHDHGPKEVKVADVRA